MLGASTGCMSSTSTGPTSASAPIFVMGVGPLHVLVEIPRTPIVRAIQLGGDPKLRFRVTTGAAYGGPRASDASSTAW